MAEDINMNMNMNISVNGQSKVPPGFRFHPTEEELLHYYLRKKVTFQKIDLDVIRDVDLNKLEPWDIQEKCRIGTTPQNDWYFFCHKDKKYPTGTRTNRATAAGFWKATGRDKIIYSHGKRIGMRKTLVFYKGRAPHGQKSDWIMHEYRLEDDNGASKVSSTQIDQSQQEEGLVVCRIFKKRSHHKTLERIPSSTSVVTRDVDYDRYDNDGSLEQILEQMGSTSSKDDTSRGVNLSEFNGFHVESCYQPSFMEDEANTFGKYNASQSYRVETSVAHWSAFDHLVATQLNGQSETGRQLEFFNNDDQVNCFSSFVANKGYLGAQDSEVDLWRFSPNFPTRSGSLTDPLIHVPNYEI